MILLVSQSASLGWLFLLEVWILLFWLRWASQGRSPSVRKLDQLLVLLVPGAGLSGRRLITARRQDTIRALGRYRTLAGLRRSAWHWRVPLGAVYAQGYQVASENIASESIASAGEVAHGRELLGEAVEALKTERASGGANVPTREDPIVVLAYGLGAWPPGADLTSLEQLLGHLGLSQPELRAHFESLIRPMAAVAQSRAFRELAGASFVLGAASRIVEAAPPGSSVPSNPWLAGIKAHLR